MSQAARGAVDRVEVRAHARDYCGTAKLANAGTVTCEPPSEIWNL
jgi:hypothetical protein